MTIPEIAVGRAEFELIRRNNSFFIDKTLLIKKWWETDNKITMITRPRRFGKTLNISMMDRFFSDRWARKGDILFGSAGERKELKIWNEKIEGNHDYNLDLNLDAMSQPQTYKELQGKFPVISLSFAGIGGEKFGQMLVELARVFRKLYSSFREALKDETLENKDFLDYLEIFDVYSKGLKESSISSDVLIGALKDSLCTLSNALYNRGVHIEGHEKPVKTQTLLFIDEYDAPIQCAYINGYWEKLQPLMRGLFEQTFKNNMPENYIYRALMTGITNMENGSIFSGLNNLKVCSIIDPSYSEFFGFTKDEVEEALDLFGLQAYKTDVERHYDGYIFGNCENMYNPLSITKFLNDASETKKARPNEKIECKNYWENTSSVPVVQKLVENGNPQLKSDLAALLRDGYIYGEVLSSLSLEDLDTDTNAVWNLLLSAGYLRAEKKDNGKWKFSSVNEEVSEFFNVLVNRWYRKSELWTVFMDAMINGDIGAMNESMNDVADSIFCAHDVKKGVLERTSPENFYHGFVLGASICLRNDYLMKSECMAGNGRYDMLFWPKKGNTTGHPIVMEFKVARSASEKALDTAADEALNQIKKQKYDAEILGFGFPKEQILYYGFAFYKKSIKIKIKTYSDIYSIDSEDKTENM